MPEEMAILAMDRHEIFRLHELQNQLLLFLAGVTRNVNYASGIVVIHQRSAAEHVIEHSKDGSLIAGNDARGKNHAVVFVHRNVAVIVYRDTRKGRHRLGLAAACENYQTLGIEAANVLRPHDHAVRNAQKVQRVRNLDIVNHAAPDERHFAVDAHGDINYLLDAVNGGSEARQNYATRRRTAQFFDARHNGALRRREARPLDVGRITEKSQHAFAAIFGERMQIKSRAIDGRLVNLEVSCVNDHAKGRSNRECNTIQSTVRYGNKLNFVRPSFDETAGNDFAQRRGIKQPRFFQALFHQRQRKARSINRNIQIAKNVRQRADMVFMSVRQHDGMNFRTVLLQVGNIRDDEINAQKLGLGEHHAGVNDDDVVTEPQDHHVHAEFAEPAKRNSGKRVR